MSKGRFNFRSTLRQQYSSGQDGSPLIITTPSNITLTKGQQLSVALTQTGAIGTAFWSLTSYAQFDENDTNLFWLNNIEPAAGVYTVTVRLSDEQQRQTSKDITVTLNAAVAMVPDAVTGLSVTALTAYTAIAAFTPPTNTPPTGYKYQLDGGPLAELQADRRIPTLSPNTNYTFTLYPYNANGTGPGASVVFATLALPLPIPGEQIIAQAFDETNASDYTFPNVAVGAGVAGKELEIIVFTQSGTAHVHNTVSVGSAATLQQATPAGNNDQISHWKIPWGAGQPPTANIAVAVRDSTNTNPFTVLRCKVWVRPLLNRPTTKLSSGVVTAAPLDAVLADTPAGALVSISSGALQSAADLTADITNALPDPAGETYDTALNTVIAHHSPPDLEASRTINVTWKDPLGVAGVTGPKLAYVVYDAAPPAAAPINTEWSDNVVESFAVATHFDWGRSDYNDPSNGYNIWTYNKIANLSDLFGQMGARYFRCRTYGVTATGNNQQLKSYVNYLYSTYGIRGFGPVADLADAQVDVEDRMTKTITQLNAGGVKRWLGFEGMNEANQGRPAGWNTGVQAGQKIIYQKAMALDNTLEVIAPSIFGRNDNDRQTLLNTADGIDPYSTIGCIHLYNGGRNTDLCGVPLAQGTDETGSGDMPIWQAIRDAKALTPLKSRLWATETGFQLGNPQGVKGFTMPAQLNDPNLLAWQYNGDWRQAYGNNNMSNRSFMIYSLRFIFECLCRGAQYGYSMYTHYDLIDDVDTRPNKCFGILYPNQAENALVKRPVYAAYQRLLALFADRGTWNGSAWQFTTPPAVSGLNPKITGGDALTFPIVDGQSVRGKWYKKRDGSFLGVLWQNNPTWDRNVTFTNPTPVTNYPTPNDLFPARRAITVFPNVGQTFSSIQAYEPTFDNTGTYGNDGGYNTTDVTATARKTVSTTDQIALNLPSHITVIRAVP